MPQPETLPATATPFAEPDWMVSNPGLYMIRRHPDFWGMPDLFELDRLED